MSTPCARASNSTARRPCVVHDDQRAVCVRDFGDGRNVLHFHGDRAGTLAPHHARVRLEERLDIAADGGRIERGFDAEPLQHESRELAVGAIDALRHQNVVAGLQKREVDGRDGALAAGRDQRAEAAFELANPRRPAQASWACRRVHRCSRLHTGPSCRQPRRRRRNSVVEPRYTGVASERKPLGHPRIRVDELGRPVLLHSRIIGSSGTPPPRIFVFINIRMISKRWQTKWLLRIVLSRNELRLGVSGGSGTEGDRNEHE